ncbi:MAG: hypothetical protein OSB25_03855 [Salibacteraceae bacterium]|nr:hypothetical protein [Salibacteraceae bacterium]
MKKLVFLLLLVSFHCLLFGQKPIMDLMKGMKPRFIGPAGMSGRVTSVDVHPNDLDHLLIGTASGGVWESKNGGISFDPIFDKQPIQSIGAVTFDPSNPSIVWAGTGEGNPRNSQSSGIGIYKSIDGGKNWELAGLEHTKTIHRIIVDPTNSAVVYVASLGSAWGPNEDRGVFKTINGGETWEKMLFINDTTGCADLVMDPSNPNKLIAAMWHYHRRPWTFTSGGKGSGIHVSYDGGKTWKQKTEKEGLPVGIIGRVGLSFATNKPNIVYALVEAKKTGLYKSIDGGENWRLVSTKNIGNRPFYYADIYVDPTNENRLFNLYSTVTRSEDGGKSFKGIAPYHKAHPDHHAFWIEPKEGKFIIDGNDGGLLISRNGGDNWQYVSNLPLGQFYHINVDNQIPYNIYGGLQDNGSWVGPSYVYEQGGIRNHHWSEVLFGDGFDVLPNKSNPDKLYAMYQGGSLTEVDKKTGYSSFIQPQTQDSIPLRYSWNAALSQDPFNDCGVYFGSQYVHYSKDCGKNWTVLSPDLTTNDTSKQKQVESGGLTIDATKAENHTTILAIAPSPLDSNLIYVGTDDGNLQATIDGGKSWSNLSAKLPGMPNNAWIPQIVCSEQMSGEAFVVVNNYRQNDWKPYLYKTIDYGKTWSLIANESNVNGYCLSVVQDPLNRSLLFLGTQQGLYVSLNGGNTWNKWNDELPSMPIRDMKIHPREHDLVLGTFGRAIIIIDDISPLRALADKKEEIRNDSLLIFGHKEAYQTPWKQAKGIRFTGDSEFKGANRRSNYSVRVWVSPDMYRKASGADGKKKPEVELFIKNNLGDTVNYYRRKVDSLINNYIPITLHEAGPNWLSRKKIDLKGKRAIMPPGKPLLAGNYSVVAVLDSVYVQHNFIVKEHPENGKTNEYRIAQRAAYDEVSEIVKPILKDVERLKDMEQVMKTVTSNMSLLEDSAKKDLTKLGKQVSDTLNQLFELYFLPKGFEGYDHVSIRISNLSNNMQTYLRAENRGESGNYELSKGRLLFAWEAAHKKQEAFEQGIWFEYQSKVSEQKFDFFKKLKED